MRRSISASFVAILALALLGAPASGSARPAKTTQALGIVTLFQNTNHTGVAQFFRYRACALNARLTGSVGSFDNRPLAGCKVVLSNGYGRFELCAGRGVIPERFRVGSHLSVERGTSLPCGFRARAAGTRVT